MVTSLYVRNIPERDLKQQTKQNKKCGASHFVFSKVFSVAFCHFLCRHLMIFTVMTHWNYDMVKWNMTRTPACIQKSEGWVIYDYTSYVAFSEAFERMLSIKTSNETYCNHVSWAMNNAAKDRAIAEELLFYFYARIAFTTICDVFTAGVIDANELVNDPTNE